jgi:hypothetical protein
VRRIVAIEDPVLRNLEITYCYARLAAAFAATTGAGANWCTFATWASRQAGSTIRGEDVQAHVRRRLARHADLLHPIASLWRALLRRGLLNPNSRLGRITAGLHTPFDAVERAGAAVARGNLKVFEEIGLEFARYLALGEVRPFPESQRYLGYAFAHYERLRTETDPKTRAELLLVANLEIGIHEQARLQPEIQEALDAPYATAQDLGWLAARLQRAGSELAREAITESFMVLSLPGRVLALGSHLPDEYPPHLQQLADEELVTLIALYEPAAPAPDDCGARDWAVLEQRMHYIVHLFRALHEQPTLFDPPFTPAQIASIRAGVIPDGDL